MTRHPLILAAVAGALTLGACGSGTDTNGAPSGSRQDRALDGALKFAKCMRDHGLDFPDPTSAGNGRIELRGPVGGKRMSPEDPRMRTAQAACEKYLNAGGGPPIDPAEQAKMQDAFVGYARCMRAKGIDMPDPKVASGGGVQMRVQGGVGGGKGPDSPVFKAADTACHHFLAEIEKAGGKAQAP